MKDLLKIRVNKKFGSYEAGAIIKVQHNKGIPVDKYWRDRIKDSEFDDCVTVIQPADKKKSDKDKVNKEV